MNDKQARFVPVQIEVLGRTPICLRRGPEYPLSLSKMALPVSTMLAPLVRLVH